MKKHEYIEGPEAQKNFERGMIALCDGWERRRREPSAAFKGSHYQEFFHSCLVTSNLAFDIKLARS
jgi:hypothetical protein